MANAIFALDRNGRVHHTGLPYPYHNSDFYEEADSWRDIVRITTGLECALFGLTADGRVLTTGGGPGQQYLKQKLSTLTDVVDFCVTNAESRIVWVLTKDGKVCSTDGQVLDLPPVGGNKFPVFGSSTMQVLVCVRNGKLYRTYPWTNSLAEVEDWPPVRSFSVGYVTTYGQPFVVAITE